MRDIFEGVIIEARGKCSPDDEKNTDTTNFVQMKPTDCPICLFWKYELDELSNDEWGKEGASKLFKDINV
jgi:hypothetical protein